MGMAKAERLLFLINLIRSHRNLTSGELAERSGVSERTIFRDINSLASARFPIYYDRGYKFLEGAFLPTLNLSREELSALDFVFEFSPLKSEKSLSLLARDIHTKLEAGRRNPNSEKAARSVRVGENQDSPSEGMSRLSELFRSLNHAIIQKKAVRIRHQKRAAHSAETLIEPYALVRGNPSWLVLCYCHDCGKTASYDISKIENVSPTSEPFTSKLSLDKIFMLHR
jgi:predicted DNA-binding transcriptional regulator YafY